MKGKISIILFIIAMSQTVLASDTIQWISSLGIDVRPSIPFSSYRDDILNDMLDVAYAKNTSLASSIHVQYGFSFPGNSSQGRIYPGAWQGLGASVNFLGNPKGVGTPVALYVFQGAPIWHFSNRLSLNYEWNFGISSGWKPCDGKVAYSNLIVGSRSNAYINLGGGISYRLGEHWKLMMGVDLTHYSNGNTSYPNPGVNMAGLKIGVIRTFGTDHMTEGNAQKTPQDPIERRRRPEFDITAYGAIRKRAYRGGDNPIILPGHFAVAGIDIASMWRVSRNFRAGASADFQWDESTDLKRHHICGDSAEDIRFSRPPFFSQVCVGLSGRAELVMPLFSVNIGIGYNFIGPEESRAFYQLANLKVRITDSVFLNIGYQLLNFQKQNNLMLGVGYTFR